MIHEDITISGSLSISGSFSLPTYASSSDYPSPQTGSMYNDTTDNQPKIYTGTQWKAIEVTSAYNVEYLVVAGGGAGGGWGGGGGAGGLISSSFNTDTSIEYTITVGGGAAGGPLSYNASAYVQGGDGTDSTITGLGFTTITATGGGGGGPNNGSGVAGGAGGSGIVILRFPSGASVTVSPGTNTVTCAPDGSKLATFTVSGTNTVTF